MVDLYLLEEMDSPLFQVVRSTGEVLGKVDILGAEGLEHREKRNGFHVEWIERGAIKERKYVRNLISQYKAGTTYQLHTVVNTGL